MAPGKRIRLPKQETWIQSPGGEDPLEKEMATHSSIFAWKIPWTEEPGRLQPKGSQSQIRLKRLSSSSIISHLEVMYISFILIMEMVS